MSKAQAYRGALAIDPIAVDAGSVECVIDLQTAHAVAVEGATVVPVFVSAENKAALVDANGTSGDRGELASDLGAERVWGISGVLADDELVDDGLWLRATWVSGDGHVHVDDSAYDLHGSVAQDDYLILVSIETGLATPWADVIAASVVSAIPSDFRRAFTSARLYPGESLDVIVESQRNRYLQGIHAAGCLR